MASNNNTSNLPMNALDNVPTPKPDAKSVTALKNDNGRVTGYQLSDGQVLDKPQAVSLAKEGGIAGVGVSHRGDNEYLKSLPDGEDGNNLGNLPSV